jgi:hypothetical protein
MVYSLLQLFSANTRSKQHTVLLGPVGPRGPWQERKKENLPKRKKNICCGFSSLYTVENNSCISTNKNSDPFLTLG